MQSLTWSLSTSPCRGQVIIRHVYILHAKRIEILSFTSRMYRKVLYVKALYLEELYLNGLYFKLLYLKVLYRAVLYYAI